MRQRSVILIFAGALVLQMSFLNLAAVFGRTPHLILALLIAIVFYFNSGYRAIPYGAGAMLLLDICTARFVGVGTLCLLIAAGLVVLLRTQLNTERYLPTLFTGVAAMAVYYLAYWGIMSLLGQVMDPGYMLVSLLPSLIGNLVIISFLFLYFSKRKQPEGLDEPLEILLTEADVQMSFEEAKEAMVMEPTEEEVS